MQGWQQVFYKLKIKKKKKEIKGLRLYFCREKKCLFKLLCVWPFSFLIAVMLSEEPATWGQADAQRKCWAKGAIGHEDSEEAWAPGHGFQWIVRPGSSTFCPSSSLVVWWILWNSGEKQNLSPREHIWSHFLTGAAPNVFKMKKGRNRNT